MNGRNLQAAVFLLMAVAVAPASLACPACGDKFGVPFERIHSGHGATAIILFARPDSALRSYNRQAGLVRRLERSGHTVHVIENDQDLEGALHANRTDLVLAEPADATALRLRWSGEANAPLFLSLSSAARYVTDAGPQAQTCQLQAVGNQSMELVRSIEELISSRQAGNAIDCGATPSAS